MHRWLWWSIHGLPHHADQPTWCIQSTYSTYNSMDQINSSEIINKNMFPEFQHTNIYTYSITNGSSCTLLMIKKNPNTAGRHVLSSACWTMGCKIQIIQSFRNLPLCLIKKLVFNISSWLWFVCVLLFSKRCCSVFILLLLSIYMYFSSAFHVFLKDVLILFQILIWS